jgi:hypothetical protein
MGGEGGVSRILDGMMQAVAHAKGNSKSVKTRRFRVERSVNTRGYSRWVNPAMGGYMMACCDCGLVHEMQFRVIEKGKTRKDGSYRYRPLRKPDLAVSFRARRAARETKSLRAGRRKSSQT